MAATIFDRMDLRKGRLARLSYALHKRAGGVSAEEFAAICREVYKIVDPVADRKTEQHRDAYPRSIPAW